jgi:hypothetical protein
MSSVAARGRDMGFRQRGSGKIQMLTKFTGIKEFSSWPTIPQLYINKEFIGGCDILVNMHSSGELAELLEKEGVLVPAAPEAEEQK